MWKRILCMVAFFCAFAHGRAQYKSPHGDGIDDVLTYVPLASAYVLKVAGVDGDSSWKRLMVNTAASYALAMGGTWSLKRVVGAVRPDGSDLYSFPSGHAAMAFAGAVILDKEYRHVSPWISVAGYAVATFTAIDRVVKHRHEWADVAAGSAIGASSAFLGYWLGDKLTGERGRYAVSVGPNVVNFSMNF